MKLTNIKIRTGTDIREIDVSNHTSLTYLDCSHNSKLEKINVSGCTALTYLNCNMGTSGHFNHQYSYLQELDVSDCKNLLSLNCQGQELRTLDLKNNPDLHTLDCQNNYLVSLDISQCVSLGILYCQKNQLKTLDVSNKPNLAQLYCNNNNIKELNVSNNPKLWILCPYSNHISTLDLGNLPLLEQGPSWSYRSLAQSILYQKVSSEGILLFTKYKFDFRSIIPEGKIANISSDTVVGYDKDGKEIETSYENGIATFSSLPEKIHYDYLTGSIGEWWKTYHSMPVTVWVELDSKAEKPKIKNGNSFPSIKTGESVSLALNASGTKPITWTYEGTLPEGLYLDSDTGIIDGTPQNVYNNSVKFTATNSAGSVSKNIKFRINAANPKIKATKFSNTAVKDEYYDATFEATGVKYVVWTASGLPTGLRINNFNGKIFGTPSVAGKFKVQVFATNLLKTAKKSFTLNVYEYPEITTETLGAGTVGQSYKGTKSMTATGTKTIKWFAEGLPNGMKLSKAGKFSGKPKEAGTFNVTIKAENSVGSDVRTYSLVINEKLSTSLPLTENATPISELQTEKVNSISERENVILIGEERSPENLTSQELSKLEGYIIAAVLPEIKVLESGQYDFEVKIDDNIPTGAKLFWFAFSESQNSDDDIADFYNISGEEISTVPDEKIIIVSPWLNENVTYRPVIAVEK